MAKYRCSNCNATLELHKTTLVIVNGKAEAKEALCNCGTYMQNIEKFKGWATIHRPDSDTNHSRK